MSEKKARYCLGLLRDELPDGIDKVLAQPPDLAALLQEIDTRIVCVNARRHDSILVEREQDRLQGILDALYSLQDHIQETICLTDDGWKWVE